MATATAVRGSERSCCSACCVNPGAPGLTLPIEQVFADPARRFHTLDLALPLHGGGTRRVSLGPNEYPWPVFEGEFSPRWPLFVMIPQSPFEGFGLAHVESTVWVLKYINPELRRVGHGRVGPKKQKAVPRECVGPR